MCAKNIGSLSNKNDGMEVAEQNRPAPLVFESSGAVCGRDPICKSPLDNNTRQNPNVEIEKSPRDEAVEQNLAQSRFYTPAGHVGFPPPSHTCLCTPPL